MTRHWPTDLQLLHIFGYGLPWPLRDCTRRARERQVLRLFCNSVPSEDLHRSNLWHPRCWPEASECKRTKSQRELFYLSAFITLSRSSLNGVPETETDSVTLVVLVAVATRSRGSRTDFNVRGCPSNRFVQWRCEVSSTTVFIECILVTKAIAARMNASTRWRRPRNKCTTVSVWSKLNRCFSQFLNPSHPRVARVDRCKWLMGV
jgi:hypothetical protein